MHAVAVAAALLVAQGPQSAAVPALLERLVPRVDLLEGELHGQLARHAWLVSREAK
jgi:hypothetical protein